MTELGFVVGFALKKVLRLVLVLAGLAFVGLKYLDYLGFITIHYDKLFEGFQRLAEGEFTLPTFLSANIPLAGASAVGLGMGFKVG